MMKNDIIYLMKLRELKDKLIYAINNDLNNEENYKSAKDIYEEYAAFYKNITGKETEKSFEFLIKNKFIE